MRLFSWGVSTHCNAVQAMTLNPVMAISDLHWDERSSHDHEARGCGRRTVQSQGLFAAHRVSR